MSADSTKAGAISLKKLALLYAAKGFHVLPVHAIQDGQCSCRDADKCAKPGKHPLTSRGVKDATTDRNKIKEWWTANPDANIGVATGMCRLLLRSNKRLRPRLQPEPIIWMRSEVQSALSNASAVMGRTISGSPG